MNRFAALMGMAALLALSMGAYAQNDQDMQQQKQQQQQQSITGGGAGAAGQQQQMGQVQVFRSEELIGKKVTNQQNENLGSIKDIVLTQDRNSVAYVVLSSGGTLGMGGKDFAVPFNALQMRPGADQVTLNISKQRLDQAQGFKEDAWPSQPDYNLFGSGTGAGTGMGMGATQPMPTQPAAGQTQQQRMQEQQRQQEQQRMQQQRTQQQTGAGAGAAQQTEQQRQQEQQRMQQQRQQQMSQQQGQMMCPHMTSQTLTKEQMKFRRASELTGLDVENRQEGVDLGDLEDIAIAKTQQGEAQIIYGIISYGGTLGMGERYVAVPWNVINIRPTQEQAMVDVDRQTLDSLSFTGDNYPDLASRDYGQRAAQQFDTQPYWEVFGFAPSGQQQQMSTQVWTANSEYLRKFSAQNIQTIQGTIVSVGTFRPEPNSVEGLRLRVRNQQGQVITVHAGPRPYAQQQGIMFTNGQQVTVKGAQADFQGRNVIMASEVTSEGKTLRLLNEQGQPQWNAQQLQQTGRQQTGAGAGAADDQQKKDQMKSDKDKDMKKDQSEAD